MRESVEELSAASADGREGLLGEIAEDDGLTGLSSRGSSQGNAGATFTNYNYTQVETLNQRLSKLIGAG